MRYKIEVKTVPNGKLHRFGKWVRFCIVDSHVKTLNGMPMRYVTDRNLVFISEIVDSRNTGKKSKCSAVLKLVTERVTEYNERWTGAGIEQKTISQTELSNAKA